MTDVRGELDPRFSSPEAKPTPWKAARDVLDGAKTYWLTTVRRDGRPHVTTIAGVWLDETFHFTTGPDEQKARNLESGNTHVVVVTGGNAWEGLDVVLEGEAVRVSDPDRLRRVAEAFTAKYDDFFRLRLVDDRLGWVEDAEAKIEGREAAKVQGGPLAFAVRATKAFAFGKGDSFSQTRWRF
jgi:general stress protein 26